MLRPNIRIPLWAAAALPVVAYALRSAVRGTLAPDLPDDLVVLVVLVFVLLLAARHRTATHGRRNELADEMRDGDDAEGERG